MRITTDRANTDSQSKTLGCKEYYYDPEYGHENEDQGGWSAVYSIARVLFLRQPLYLNLTKCTIS